MAIEINQKLVAGVLLSDGEWHRVKKGSLDIGDAWPWQEAGETTGAEWIEVDETGQRRVFCPLSAVCAVAYEWDGRSK